MMVPCTIEFFRKLSYDVPCAWLPTEYRYVVCASCVEGKEIRYCNGTTKHTYNICPEHQLGIDDGKTYDQEFLVWVRESLEDGILTRPPGVIQPKLGTTSNNFDVHIEPVKGSEDAKVGVPQIKEYPDRHTYTPQPGEAELVQQNSAEKISPKGLSQEYSHAENCNYGINPSSIIASARAMTTLERQMREGHQRLYWHGCEFCIREAFPEPSHIGKEVDLMVKRDSESGKPLGYAHCSECVSTLNRIAWEACHVPRVFRAIFFKRCNNEYVNALGYRLESTYRSSSDSAKYLQRNPDFTYTALKGREEMLSFGSIDDENLIQYSWWRNQEYARKKDVDQRAQCENQDSKEVVEGKLEFRFRIKEWAEAALDLTEQQLKRLELEVRPGKQPAVAQQRRDSGVEFF